MNKERVPHEYNIRKKIRYAIAISWINVGTIQDFRTDAGYSRCSIREEGYEQMASSELLPQLDIALFVRCMNIANQVEAIK